MTGSRHAGRDLASYRLFSAWSPSATTAPCSETGQAPLARWAAGLPLPLPSPAQLHRRPVVRAAHRPQTAPCPAAPLPVARPWPGVVELSRPVDYNIDGHKHRTPSSPATPPRPAPDDTPPSQPTDRNKQTTARLCRG